MVKLLLLHVHRQRRLVQKYPVATKRVLPAILKTSDICAAEPEWAARRLVEGAFTPTYDLALQTLTEVPLRPVAGVRPRGLAPLLRVAPPRDGMIKSSPNAILPHATEWCSLNELLKLELKT